MSNPKNAFESLLLLKISATGRNRPAYRTGRLVPSCVTEINFDIEIFQPQWDTPRGILYSCRQNCLRALPVALLQRLMTIPNTLYKKMKKTVSLPAQ